MKTQVEFLEEALRLKKENPEMDIFFCVHSDDMIEDALWTKHAITSVKISDWYCDDERIYIDSDEVFELFGDRLYVKGMTDTEIEALAEKAAKENITQKICVFTSVA